MPMRSLSADPAMVRETIRQIVEARSGPELVAASRLARALVKVDEPTFHDLILEPSEGTAGPQVPGASGLGNGQDPAR